MTNQRLFFIDISNADGTTSTDGGMMTDAECLENVRAHVADGAVAAHAYVEQTPGERDFRFDWDADFSA